MARRYKAPPKASTADLDVLHPDRVVLVGGAEWVVREYSLRESARLHPVGVQYARTREENRPDPAALVHLLAAATGHSPIEVAGLADDDFTRLAEAWDAVNLHLYVDERRPAKGEAVRWADIYATLIAGGHTLADISNYTARQIRLFFEAAQRANRQHRASLVSDVNHAFAGGKAAAEQIRKLQKNP